MLVPQASQPVRQPHPKHRWPPGSRWARDAHAPGQQAEERRGPQPAAPWGAAEPPRPLPARHRRLPQQPRHQDPRLPGGRPLNPPEAAESRRREEPKNHGLQIRGCCRHRRRRGCRARGHNRRPRAAASTAVAVGMVLLGRRAGSRCDPRGSVLAAEGRGAQDRALQAVDELRPKGADQVSEQKRHSFVGCDLPQRMSSPWAISADPLPFAAAYSYIRQCPAQHRGSQLSYSREPF
mmetsp:Transcript_27396/g.64888  ORF Transcript_27396/g.64888 Transcript_27396/m.64888 type:complete len:236 (-) Transcript_27396:26-733(-)